MRLSDAQVNLVTERLRTLPSHGTCSLCDANQWSITDTILELREFTSFEASKSSTVMPVIAVTCNNCYNTQFLNAIRLGFVSEAGALVEEVENE